MSLNLCILLNKKLVIPKSVTKSCVVTKYMVTKSRFHCTPSIPMGVYRSVRSQRFGMRPSTVKATRTQKPLKKGKNSLKMPFFERFLDSSSFKTWWSHFKPRKSNSMGSPRSVDPHGHPGGVLIAKWIKNQLDLPQWKNELISNIFANFLRYNPEDINKSVFFY